MNLMNFKREKKHIRTIENMFKDSSNGRKTLAFHCASFMSIKTPSSLPSLSSFYPHLPFLFPPSFFPSPSFFLIDHNLNLNSHASMQRDILHILSMCIAAFHSISATLIINKVKVLAEYCICEKNILVKEK